jgi:type VI secretion system protein ImpH
MAGAERRAGNSVRSIFARGPEFDFYQAVRLLTLFSCDRFRVGHVARPTREVVRFTADNTLRFPVNTVARITPAGSDPPTMVLSFFGLTGPNGILPLSYTEYVCQRIAAGDRTLADFLDIFNHRLASFVYRAWEKHRVYVSYESAAVRNEEDRLSGYLFAVIGLATRGLRDRLRIPDYALLRYAGLLAQRPRSAWAVRTILSEYFKAPVTIEQFTGQWSDISPDDLCVLEGEGDHNALGTAAAGDAVWTAQSRFRVRLGPLSLAQYLQFLPDQPAFHTLRDLASFLVDHMLDFDVQLILQREEIPDFELSDDGAAVPRLGLLGWLKTRDFDQHADDAVFDSPLDVLVRASEA